MKECSITLHSLKIACMITWFQGWAVKIAALQQARVAYTVNCLQLRRGHRYLYFLSPVPNKG